MPNTSRYKPRREARSIELTLELFTHSPVQAGSKPLWALVRAGLIADPPDAKKYSRYPMVVTKKGQAALVSATGTR